MGREYIWDSSSWPRPSRVSPPTPSTSAPAPGCSARSLLRIRMTVPSRCPRSRLVCVTTCSCTLHHGTQGQASQHCPFKKATIKSLPAVLWEERGTPSFRHACHAITSFRTGPQLLSYMQSRRSSAGALLVVVINVEWICLIACKLNEQS